MLRFQSKVLKEQAVYVARSLSVYRKTRVVRRSSQSPFSTELLHAILKLVLCYISGYYQYILLWVSAFRLMQSFSHTVHHKPHQSRISHTVQHVNTFVRPTRIPTVYCFYLYIAIVNLEHYNWHASCL